jgi:sec-independent protein translocase protein TatA
MFTNIRGWEWIIILAIVVLLFGVGRLSRIGGEIGSAIRQFRKGLKGEDEETGATPSEDDKEQKT